MPESSLASTATLIHRIQDGESGARDLLVERCLPLLRRWAHGRLPSYARDLAETDDLVQITLMRALDRIDAFEPRRQGAFLAYLRQILCNSVRNEIRRTSRRPASDPFDEAAEHAVVSERVAGDPVAEFDAYEKGLASLDERRRQAVILRLEFGMTYPEIAEELELKSADAARMSVSRSLLQVAKALS